VDISTLALSDLYHVLMKGFQMLLFRSKWSAYYHFSSSKKFV
jgi:hypothetical protein